jgi:peptidoglycan/xylan/chitin deacetylase (PgdA/CDA1 family)
MSQINSKSLCLFPVTALLLTSCLFEEGSSEENETLSSLESSSNFINSTNTPSSFDLSSISILSQQVSSLQTLSSSTITFDADTVHSYIDSLRTPIDSSKWILNNIDIQISTWKYFANSAYSLTFDDGYSSAYNHLFPLLKKHKLPATFYVITNPINKESINPTGKRVNWKQLQEMHNAGHEIGSHSISHADLTTLELGNESTPGTLIYEVAQSYKDLVDSIPGNIPYTFAYPYTTANTILKTYSEKYYISARAMGPAHSPTFIDWFSLGGYLQEYDNIATRTLLRDEQIGQNMADFIQKTVISKGKWGILLAHEVVPFDSLSTHNSWHPHSNEGMDIFLSHLKKKQDLNQVWVGTIEEVTKYSQSRNKAQIGLLKQSSNQIEFTIDDGLSNIVYDSPLSLSIALDSSWKKVLLVQGTKSTELKIQSNHIKFNALANGKNIKITKIH